MHSSVYTYFVKGHKLSVFSRDVAKVCGHVSLTSLRHLFKTISFSWKFRNGQSVVCVDWTKCTLIALEQPRRAKRVDISSDVGGTFSTF